MISMIAAVGKNLELGKNNDLIWHLDGDLPYFKSVTMGKSVIMGLNTFRSLPKALPGRKNIVIALPGEFEDSTVTVVNSIAEAIELVKNEEEAFVIGGASIYRQFIDYASKLYLTEADAECKDADVYFPQFDKALWKKEDRGEGGTDIKYKRSVYKKIN